MSKPIRIQRQRKKGWKAPPNTIIATRGTGFGNPFKVSGLFKIGKGTGHGGFCWLQCVNQEHNDGTFTLIETNEQAVEWYREYLKRYPLSEEQLERLRKADFVACFCNLDKPCHTAVLIELANA